MRKNPRKYRLAIGFFVLLLVSLYTFHIYKKYYEYDKEYALYQVYVSTKGEELFRSNCQTIAVKDYFEDNMEESSLLEIKVMPEQFLKVSGKQNSAVEADGDLDAHERQRYLASTALMDPQQNSIVALSKKLTINCKEDIEKAEAISDWISSHVTFDANFANLANASPEESKTDLEILADLSGGRTEYATLFASLTRAQGIPTRLVAGHVFASDGRTTHVWNEIYLNEFGWVTIDPYYNRMGADNRYIRFFEGLDYLDFSEKLSGLKFGVERINW